MTHFRFLYFKSSSQSWFDQAASLYQAKIQHFAPFELKALKSQKWPRDKAEFKVLDEEKRLLSAITAPEKVVLFDEGGRRFASSEEFSRFLGRFIEESVPNVTFVVGGPYGVTDKIRQRADAKVALSPLTLSHQVAIVMALEQIYRAFCIRSGRPYHNE